MIVSPEYLERMAEEGRSRRVRTTARRELVRREKVIASAIGAQAGKRVTRARLQRPFWMPGPLYRLLVRSILIEERS